MKMEQMSARRLSPHHFLAALLILDSALVDFVLAAMLKRGGIAWPAPLAVFSVGILLGQIGVLSAWAARAMIKRRYSITNLFAWTAAVALLICIGRRLAIRIDGWSPHFAATADHNIGATIAWLLLSLALYVTLAILVLHIGKGAAQTRRV